MKSLDKSLDRSRERSNDKLKQKSLTYAVQDETLGPREHSLDHMTENKMHGALVELLHKQLDSKEQIIRSQQDTINELRLTLSC